jgi:hypothetical protein
VELLGVRNAQRGLLRLAQGAAPSNFERALPPGNSPSVVGSGLRYDTNGCGCESGLEEILSSFTPYSVKTHTWRAAQFAGPWSSRSPTVTAPPTGSETI